MTNADLSDTAVTSDALAKRKRIVFTMGGKGGVGKTAMAAAIAEWYAVRQIPCALLDLDMENKAVGSLQHYFPAADKANIHTPSGLDIFLDRLHDDNASVILADMGGGSGSIAQQWFDTMYQDLAGLGLAFTAVGVVTPDPASVDSVLGWASNLQNRVSYVIVENAVSPISDFTYWNRSQQAARFREFFKPVVIASEFRLLELEHACRQYGLTLGRVASRDGNIQELQRTSLIIRAQAYRRRLIAQIDKAEELLIP
jgi:MinD-like ATPase involved in chromosome partitioning or flagellar assembly